MFFVFQGFIYGQNVAPILSATGNQLYCPLTPIKIVTDMTIVDPDDLGIDAIYIQISSGYVNGQDVLTLTGFHPTIASNWNAGLGKLTLSGIISQPTYTDLVAAIKDVEFYNSSSNPSGTRNFSITVGQANYLPSNGHYYLYFPNLGITWTSAKTAAQNSTYYGLQGYLATITSQEEAQLAGEQAPGAGWIGGSDATTPDVWKWVTGPENGLTFWNGSTNGTTPNFAFWNTGEPNNFDNRGEDYAHITAPGVGIPGSWNDLTNTGDPNGNYQPKGYVVEYGGMLGDPVLQISTSSIIVIPTINAVTSITNCGPASFTLNATAQNGTVKWYDSSIGGNLLATGDNFTTPFITITTNYYLDAFPVGCSTSSRVPFTVTINPIPVLSVPILDYYICDNNTAILSATTDFGIVNWFASASGGNPIGTGNNFTTPVLNSDTTYYAESNNNGCISNRIAVNVTVYPLPIVTDEQFVICQNQTIQLSANVSNATYLWSTGETIESISVSNGGIYTVVVTSLSAGNCSATKTFTVTENQIPVIDNVVIDNNSVTISLLSTGDYDYSIDGNNFQESSIFSNLPGGIYTLTIREKNGCGSIQTQFAIIEAPKYFTPNGDGINDLWMIKGLQLFNNAQIRIFDRFGKFVTFLNEQKNSWDGTLNGQLLISDDYWYIMKTDNNLPEIRGHFSIKR